MPSLLLRRRLAAGPEGTGGASPLGGCLPPGTGGALPIEGADETPPEFPTTGADRSLVTAFLSLVPLWISERSAFYLEVSHGIRCIWFHDDANQCPTPVYLPDPVLLQALLEGEAGDDRPTLPAEAAAGEGAAVACLKN